MTIIAALIAIAGNLLAIYGSIILIVMGFKKNFLWVLAFFLLPPFGVIVFTILNIKEAWKPWAFIVGGFLIAELAVQMSPKLREKFEEDYTLLKPIESFEINELTRRDSQHLGCA